MHHESPYNITPKQAAELLKLPENELLKSSIPYLQYSDDQPRYYKKSDLDEFMAKNIQKKGKPEFFTQAAY